MADRAFDAAFSGDLRQAQDAIDKLRIAGAPNDLLQTLEGLALFVKGNNREAIAKLEKTIAENRESMAALPALWWAFYNSSDFGSMFRVEKLIKDRNLSAKTDYEKVFQCLIDTATSPAEGIGEVLERLDELTKKHRRWGTAYAIRAMARRQEGQESQKLDDFRKAIADFDTAQSLMPDSPFVLTIGLSVLTDTIRLAKYQDGDADVLAWRKQAEQIVNSLDQWPDHLTGQREVAVFSYATGQSARAKDIEDQLVKRGLGGPITELRNLETSTLEGRLRANKDADSQTCLAIVLAVKSDEGREEALQVFNRVRLGNGAASSKVLAIDVLLLLGKPEEAVKASKELLDSNSLSREWRWWKYGTEYHAGELEEDELVRRAGPFSELQQHAYGEVAMESLARGDCEKAKEYFTKTVATGQVGTWNYHAAQAFLKRMKENDEWPTWIPPKKSE